MKVELPNKVSANTVDCLLPLQRLKLETAGQNFGDESTIKMHDTNKDLSSVL